MNVYFISKKKNINSCLNYNNNESRIQLAYFLTNKTDISNIKHPIRMIFQASTIVSVSANNVGRQTSNSTGCSLCSDREVFKEITKKTIKDEILRKLGLSSAPNVSGNHLSKMHFVRKQIEEARKRDNNPPPPPPKKIN